MADAQRVGAFLKERQPSVARHLRGAAALSVAGSFLIVMQAWLLASVINAVVLDGAELAAVASRLAFLVPVILARAVLTWGGEQAAFSAASAVKRELRSRLVRHIFRLGPYGISGEPTGRLVAAATDNLQAIEPYFSRYLPAGSLAAIIPLAIVLVVVPRDWLSAIVLAVTAPLILLFMVFIGHDAEVLNQKQWSKLARMSGHFLDVIQGLTTLKVFNASRREAAAVARMAEDYRRDTMGVLRLAFLSSLALEFFATVSIAMIAVLIGFRLMWGEMSFFNGLFVLLLAPEFYLPLRTMGSANHARMEAVGAAEHIVQLLEMPLTGRGFGKRQIMPDRRITIAFENVCVVYPDGRRALDGLTFAIEPGERVALTGPSGAGKSTVFGLLLGFIAPTSGRILIGGNPLNEIDLDGWRHQIAYLPQRPHMFHGTAAQNIAMLLDEPVTDLGAVRSAAQSAGADQFIATLPKGYDTPIGEHGIGLSGGEVQRIALARAFYRDAPLVLIDEAAAHLDRANEALVSKVVARLAKDRTMLAIAHRLASVTAADRILVLANGKLAEEGSHATLLAARGHYASQWMMAEQVNSVSA